MFQGTLRAHKDKDKDLPLSGNVLMTWPSRRPQVGGTVTDSTFRDVTNNGALRPSDDFKKQCFLVQPLEIKFVVGWG